MSNVLINTGLNFLQCEYEVTLPSQESKARKFKVIKLLMQINQDFFN